MNFWYLLKEIKYYKKRDSNLKRAFYKFLFYKTPLSRFVNTWFYNYFYQKQVDKFTRIYKPTILQIENTNFCNARCIMCPHSIMKRKQKIMKFKDFKKIVDNVLSNYSTIRLLIITGFGEPLFDKNILEKIDYVNKNYPHIKIDLYTNAGLLSKELSNKLLNMNIHKINFSINALEKNYKEIMGLDYNLVSRNIFYFCQRKKELKKEYPLINFSLMILKQNARDIKDFIKLWEKHGDSIMSYMPLNWAGSKKVDTVSEVKMKKKRWPCLPLWQNITVDVDGNIIMCCQDYESRVVFGNALKQPIKEIMNSKKFKKVRELHKKGIFNMPVCNTCDNWVNSSFSWWDYY
ncbi:MAG: radical SAM/SPASM domain-containing protein [Candidatus Pacearchaeota archaeon]